MPSTEPDKFLLQQYLQALAAASQARDMERALAIGAEATERGVEHPDLLGLAAQKHMRAGRVEVAHQLLVRARDIGPHNADVLNDLGLCLVRLGRAQEALPVLNAALRQRPNSAQLHFSKALAHEQLGQLDLERRQLERVIEIEPAHYPALSLLAMLAIDRNDDKAVRDFAGRALALSPGEFPAHIALASVDVAAGDFSAANDRLRSLLRNPALDPDNRALAQTLMGDALDREERYDEAFRFYTASAETQKFHYARRFGSARTETYRMQSERLTRYFRAAPAEMWCPGKTDTITRTHVFLLGFVRSGTTLLGQVLAGHPDIEVMHERNCLEETIADFVTPTDGLDRLATTSDEALDSYRQSYWNRARAWGNAAERRVFVDKSPLATTLLPLIARLFPGARILFTYRDPRDVVFSCFRRRFAMSQLKYEMLTLDGIATCYAGTMEFADLCREKLGLEFFNARHELLLADTETETRLVCEYLDIPFDRKMLDFASRARATNIDIPNSVDLARGLSRESEGHWRCYAKELVPVMPILAPICARLGYPEN